MDKTDSNEQQQTMQGRVKSAKNYQVICDKTHIYNYELLFRPLHFSYPSI